MSRWWTNPRVQTEEGVLASVNIPRADEETKCLPWTKSSLILLQLTPYYRVCTHPRPEHWLRHEGDPRNARGRQNAFYEVSKPNFGPQMSNTRSLINAEAGVNIFEASRTACSSSLLIKVGNLCPQSQWVNFWNSKHMFAVPIKAVNCRKDGLWVRKGYLRVTDIYTFLNAYSPNSQAFRVVWMHAKKKNKRSNRPSFCASFVSSIGLTTEVLVEFVTAYKIKNPLNAISISTSLENPGKKEAPAQHW